MKKIVLACLFLLIASGAYAQDTIYDIQTGLVPEGSLATLNGVVVVAVRDIGVFVAEAPYAGYNGIWIYTGSDDPHGLVAGDVVAICGEYKEYYDVSEIDLPAAGLYGSILKTGTQEVPAPFMITAADLLMDEEMWESCAITITDGMEVTDTSLGYGEWLATCMDGSEIKFDDWWYDFEQVAEGQCYDTATGIYFYAFGTWRLEAYADGLIIVDCMVDTEDLALGSVKAMYR